MLYRVVIILVTGVLLLINVRLYSGARAGDLDEQALKQLTYLEQALQGGAGEEMQGLFPEGFFFIHALYGLTWIRWISIYCGTNGLARYNRAIRRGEKKDAYPSYPGHKPRSGIFW